MSALYIHIPFCKQRCKYCTFVSNCDFSLAGQYIDCVIKELHLRAGQFDNITTLDTIFVGGGTPSALSRELLQKLFTAVKECYTLSDNYEFSVEVNPESMDDSLAQLFACQGVNRVSLGLQSSCDHTLKTIGRLHTAQQFVDAVKCLHRYGIDNINADIILGLPESQEQTFKSVQFALNSGVKHISVYALEVYEGSQMADDIKKGLYTVTTDSDQLSNLYDDVVALLENNGFVRYEVSNFAKSNQYQCRHNLTYWQAKNYLGVGCASHWYINNMRYANENNVKKYIDLINNHQEVATCYEQLTVNDIMDEVLMLGLRLDSGVNIEQFAQQFNVSVFDRYSNLQNLIDKHFLQIVNGNLVVPKDKIYVLNSILTELL